MLHLQNRQNRGFTLIELLIVIALFGVFIGAVYSLYITHLRTALSREEVIDVQQNVRIAMDRMTRDIRMAGFLFPHPIAIATTPVNEKAMSSYSTIRIQTGTAEGTFVSINSLISGSKFSVTPAAVLTNFTPGVDSVNIFRPSTRALVGGVFSILSSSSTSGRMSISPAAATDALRLGDMVCKTPDRVQYIVDRTDVTQGCDKTSCLKRNGEVIAQGISTVRLEYFIGGGNTTPITDLSTLDDNAISKITAIRVTITGKTSKKTGADDTIKTRELTSLIKLRNFR